MFGLFEKFVSPYPEGAIAAMPQGFFRFLWAAAAGTRRYIAAMTVLTGAIGIFEALLFSLLGRVVDWLAKVPPARLWVEQRAHLLILAAILMGSVIVVALQSLIKQQTLAGNFAMRLRWNFHRNMLAQSLSFYQDEFAGRVATKVMQTALAVRDTWMILADILVFVLIYFVTIALVVGNFSLWLLAPFFGWLGCYLLAVWYFVPRLGAVAKAQADARSLMTGRITDAYTNIATVKLFSHTQREATYVQGAMAEFLQTVYRQMRMVTGFEIVNHLLSMGLIASTGGVTLWLWTRGQVGVGAVAAATAMALRLNGISHWVMWEMASLFEQIGTVQDGINTLARPPTVIDRPDALPLRVTRGDIRFEHVSFNYGALHHDTGRVIENLNIHIRAGEKIGLVGRSGAGKSTIVNLLLRFYDIPQGRVLIDGQDIAQATQDSLRAQIGMVTQDTSLLHRSVRDNILYGRPDASDAEMIAAAKRAEAHDFIMTLTDPKQRSGYQAHVGERGVKLSGGQRQRIAIARVMLKDAPILLLDEATSALDTGTEREIQSALNEVSRNRTSLVIAHRLSTVVDADEILVLDHGQIIERGRHSELLALNGHYASMWNKQREAAAAREKLKEVENDPDVAPGVAKASPV